MPKEARVPISAVETALAAARITGEQRQRFWAELAKHLPKPGRKPIDDDLLFLDVIAFLERGINPHAACRQVTRNLPEPPRKTTFKRLYKKCLAVKKEALRPRSQARGSGARQT
jgi:hypothetical protein